MCILQCLGYCPKSYVRVLTQSNTLTIAREKAAKALKEKGDTPEELLRSIKENEAVVAEAQRVVDAWKAIVGEKTRREEAAKAEAERKAAEERERAEAEEKRIAEEKAEAERKAQEERERAEEEERDRIEAELDAQKADEEAVEKDAELKEDKKKPQLKDVVKAIYEKGKSAASRLYKMAFFDVAKTPDFMKKLGFDWRPLHNQVWSAVAARRKRRFSFADRKAVGGIA